METNIFTSLQDNAILTPQPLLQEMKSPTNVNTKRSEKLEAHVGSDEILANAVLHAKQQLKCNPLRVLNLPSTSCTIIDSGTDQGWAGINWTPVKNHGVQKTATDGIKYPVIDACATLYNPISKENLAVLRLNQVLYKKSSPESLLPPDQMAWHGLTCDATPLQFHGKQEITGPDFTLPLYWDGKTVFFCHRKTTTSHMKSLPHWVLTGSSEYCPTKLSKQAAFTAKLEEELKLGLQAEAKSPRDTNRPATITMAHHKDQLEFPDFFDEISHQRRRHLLDENISHVWHEHQLAEWRERLGNVSEEVVKKTFLATTQLVPSVKHENEDNPKDYHASRFPMLKSRRLRETWYFDTVEVDLSVGNKSKKEYGLLGYGEDSKVTVYYPLGSQQTGANVLEYLWEFTRDIGMPDKICSDFATNLIVSHAYKRFMRLTLTKVHASEPGKHNQNTVERRWQDLKRHAETIVHRRSVPPEHMHRLYQHLCDCFNHTATASLNWRTPIEKLDGDTPDISVFRFKFWEPVWYLSLTTATKSLHEPRYLCGRFVGIAWTTGDNMCYKVWTDERDLVSHEIHRSVILPRHPDETFPRTLIKHRSDYFFPTVKLAKPPTTTRGQLEGCNQGNKRKVGDKTGQASKSSGEMQVDSAVAAPQSGPLEEDLRKRWLEMTAAEARRVEELYAAPAEDADHASLIGIAKHRSKMVDGKRVHYFVGTYAGGNEIEAEFDDVRLDAPYALACYIRDKKIKYPELKEWSKQYLDSLDSILQRSRLVEGKSSYVSRRRQAAESPVVSIRRCNLNTTTRRTTARKRPGRNNRSKSKFPELKYGVKVPRTVAEALLIDEESDNRLWQDAIKKEVDALMSMQTFKILSSEESKSFNREGYQYAPLRMIFDVKQDLRRKARLVLGGHVIDASGHDTYASNMKGISARILMLIAAANDLLVLTGDIGNAYLYASTQEKIYCRTGPEFASAGHGASGRIAILQKALYGTKSAANRWHAHLANTIRSMGFRSSRYDADIWYKQRPDSTGYDYIGTHTDDLMVVAKEPRAYFDMLESKYTIKKIGPPLFHLGCDYSVSDGSDGMWSIGTATYVAEALEKVKTLLGKDNLGKDNTPMPPQAQPELDASPILDVEGHRVYQQLVGIAHWLITCGRFDLCYAISSLSRFSACPREGHLKR